MKSPFDFDLWIPKGGYFVLADISKVPVMEKYMVDEQGNKRTKDYAFAYQLVHENKVVCIPISPFYDQKDSYLGEKYVRFAFCKPEEMIMEASRRMCRK
jgi:aspartate/methionine/tyrosine aminotransferase